MLRVFAKTKRLIDSRISGSSTLSNYHIKTLMMWACELKSRRWFTDDLNLVRTCARLLHMLGDWLTEARCQHYFINNSNLIDNSFNVTNTGSHLMSIDESWLSTWFVNNYIRKCSRFCPENISRLFDDISATTKLRNAASAVVAWRQNSTLLELWKVSLYTQIEISCRVHVRSLTSRLCACWMSELAKIDSRFSVYFTAIASLHVVYKSSRRGFSDDMIDIVTTLFGQFIGKRHHHNKFTSLMSVDQAAKLMKIVANNSLSIMPHMAIQLSKAYLYRALRCKDSDSDSIYCLANVYLAALYCTTEQYQTALHHCTLVMRSQDHSQCSSNVVQGELLPTFDNNVNNVLGLAEFYQYIRTAALNHEYQTQYVSVFTTELFAHYMHIKCKSVIMGFQLTPRPTSATDESREYGIRICDSEQLFVGDVLLFVSLSQLLKHTPMLKHSHQLTMNPTKYSRLDLMEILQKCAVEHLTKFCHIEAQYFGSVATIVTTDFEALFAYTHGDYQQCLQLSTQNVHTLLYARRMLSIPIFPEFIQFMDDGITSLTALTLIVNPQCRNFSHYVIINQITLSLYLMTQCQSKLHHSVTSLAQTLDYIKVAHRRHLVERTLDRLILKMIAHKAVIYLTTY